MSEEDFDTRLDSAMKDAGMADKNSNEESRFASYSALAKGMRFGLEFVSAIVVGIGIGYLLDEWLETGPIMLVIFLFIGFGSGLLNMYRAMNDMDETIGVNREQFLSENSDKKEIDK